MNAAGRDSLKDQQVQSSLHEFKLTNRASSRCCLRFSSGEMPLPLTATQPPFTMPVGSISTSVLSEQKLTGWPTRMWLGVRVELTILETSEDAFAERQAT